MMLLDVPRPMILFFLFLLGCCFGSFLNVCIHRFPSKLKLWDQLKALNSHRSGCPRCAAAIIWRDNIPLLGWLLLRGHCRNCARPISCRYPLVELLTGVLFVVVYCVEIPAGRFVDVTQSGLFSPDGPQTIRGLWQPEVWLHLRYALHMLMICGLIVATFIDFELRIIPDGCTVPVILAALVTAVAVGQVHIVPVWFQDPSVARTLQPAAPEWLQPLIFFWDAVPWAARHPHLHGLLVSLAGLLVGGGVVWLVRGVGHWVLRQEAMGFGDVVLMAMVGSVLGWQPVLAAFFIAPLVAVFAALLAWITRRDREIPYGPWLSLATLLLLLTWPWTWPLVKRFFDMGPVLGLLAVFMVSALVLSLQLVQLIKRLLGIPLYGEEQGSSPAWSSADHLTYYNSERPDEQTGQWPRAQWPGCRSGRGLSAGHQWRYGRDN